MGKLKWEILNQGGNGFAMYLLGKPSLYTAFGLAFALHFCRTRLWRLQKAVFMLFRFALSFNLVVIYPHFAGFIQITLHFALYNLPSADCSLHFVLCICTFAFCAISVLPSPRLCPFGFLGPSYAVCKRASALSGPKPYLPYSRIRFFFGWCRGPLSHRFPCYKPNYVFLPH